MCETADIPIPTAEINLIEKAIMKRNTDQEHGELLQIKNRIEASLWILSSFIASEAEVTEEEITEMN